MTAANKKRRIRRLAASLRRYHAAVALLLTLIAPTGAKECR